MTTVVSLFDESGNMGRPWAEAGAKVICYDLENKADVEKFESGGTLERYYCDLSSDWVINRIAEVYDPDIIFGFPPCTDLAVSGAMHFNDKRRANPQFQHEAVALARQVEKLGNITGKPWFAENPSRS